MVREIRLAIDFPLCTPQEFFEAIYADEEGLKIYHKLNSTEEGAEVTPWVDGERTVRFYKEVELPAAVSYLFGTSKLPVEESQRLEHHPDGGFTVLSSPEVQVNTGYKFSGKTEVTVHAKNRGSEIEVIIKCEADGPYGLIGFIESGIEKEGRKGVENFLTFCEARIAEKKVERLPCSDGDSDSLPFYEVQYETLSQCSLPDGSILETKDTKEMLTTEAIILTRIKHLEEELKISQAGTAAIMKKVEALEMALHRSRRHTAVVLVGFTALSFAFMTTVLLMKRYPSTN